MRSILTLALGGCLLLVGCADKSTEEPDPSAVGIESDDDNDDNDSAKMPASSSSAAEEVASTEPEESTEPPAAEEENPPAAETPPEDMPSAPVTKSCTATKNDQKSVTKVIFTNWTSGKVTIDQMTVLVTNKAERNKNDVNVFLTPPNAKETKAFNSGDILTHGKAVEVKDAKKLALVSGTALRVETNFDEPFFDAAASCTIKL